MKLHKFLELVENEPWVVWVVANEWLIDSGKLGGPQIINGWTFSPDSLGCMFREIVFRVGLIKYIAFRPADTLDWQQTFELRSIEQVGDRFQAETTKKVQYDIYWHRGGEERFTHCFKINERDNTAVTIQAAVDGLRATEGKEFYLDVIVRITTKISIVAPPPAPHAQRMSIGAIMKAARADGLRYLDSYDVYPIFEIYEDIGVDPDTE